MIIDPKYVVFDNTDHVIEYIMRGLPPTRNQFDRLMNRVNNPLDAPITEDGKIPDVIILERDIERWSNNEYVQNEVDYILNKVYEERIRKRDISIGVSVVAGLIGIVGSTFSMLGSKK